MKKHVVRYLKIRRKTADSNSGNGIRSKKFGKLIDKLLKEKHGTESHKKD